MSYFFFDIDGTLKPRRQDIPASIIASLKALMADGHHVFLCTGRAYYMCDHFLDVLHLDNAIVDNGMGIILHNQVIQSHPIDVAVLKKTRQLLEELHADYQLLDIYCGYRSSGLMQRFVKSIFKHSPRAMKKLEDYADSPILKIDVYFKSPVQKKYFISHMDQSLQLITNSGYNKGDHQSLYGEIVPAQYNKGTAIAELLDYTHGQLNDTYGFGDSNNDIGMLKTVKHAIVVRPGSELLNSLAEYMCDPPEKDGITAALKHYHLIA